MRKVILILSFLSTVVLGNKKQDLRLGIVNGATQVKTDGAWRTVSNKDVGMSLRLTDSVLVEDSTMSVYEYDKEGKIVHLADKGAWSVQTIVKNQAYHPAREKEKTTHSVKGINTDRIYFDVLVNEVPTKVLHFDEHPQIRVINDEDSAVYFAPIWIEGNNMWSHLEGSQSARLESKSTAFIPERNSIYASAPKGEIEIVIFLSNMPFRIQTAMDSFRRMDTPSYQGLIKKITICE